MKNGLILIVTMSAFWLATAVVGRGQEGGWKLPNLNPFSQKAKPPTSTRVNNASSSGWQWPKLWSASTPKKTKSNQPSAWRSMTAGAKSMASKTADALNPWSEPEKPATAPTGLNTGLGRSPAAKPDAGNAKAPAGWIWQSKSDEPKTVNDFLAQPRLQP